jgi:hypothetical protein
LAIPINDLKKLIKNEQFDLKWNTVLIINDDNGSIRPSEKKFNDIYKEIATKLMDYFSKNDDDSKIFVIVKNEELGYLYHKDYLPTLHKYSDKELKGLGGDHPFLAGYTNTTISDGNRINYICPIIDCTFKIQRYHLKDPKYMCEKHTDQKLVKEKI